MNAVRYGSALSGATRAAKKGGRGKIDRIGSSGRTFCWTANWTAGSYIWWKSPLQASFPPIYQHRKSSCQAARINGGARTHQKAIISRTAPHEEMRRVLVPAGIRATCLKYRRIVKERLGRGTDD